MSHWVESVGTVNDTRGPVPQMLDMAKTIRQMTMTTLTAQTTSIITYICARSVEKDITLN